MLGLLKLQVGPLVTTGETVHVSCTAELKPFADVTVIVAVADVPAWPDVVDKAARLDAFADDEDFVAGTQFEPIVDDVARDLRLAPHERQPAEQDRAAPALLLMLVEDDLAEAADIIGLHPIPRVFACHLACHDVPRHR